MIDSLVRALESRPEIRLRSELGLRADLTPCSRFIALPTWMTEDQLTRTLDAIAEIAQRIPVVFPAHPRTARNIARGAGSKR